MGGGGGCGGVGGGIPSDYLVSTQLQLWLFFCWGCGCCWAVTINYAVNCTVWITPDIVEECKCINVNLPFYWQLFQ